MPDMAASGVSRRGGRGWNIVCPPSDLNSRARPAPGASAHDRPLLTLIERGTVYAPAPVGAASVLLLDARIATVGPLDRRALVAAAAGATLDLVVIDATGCVVTSSFIDPHEHLLGGSGEEGFATQTPEVMLSDIVPHGFTTVVGGLGVDTTMKTMAGLLGRVQGLAEEGLSTYMGSGGYNVPPTTVMGSIRNDIIFLDEVIGAGEIAISDHRGVDHDLMELSTLVRDTHVGGMLARKAGAASTWARRSCGSSACATSSTRTDAAPSGCTPPTWSAPRRSWMGRSRSSHGAATPISTPSKGSWRATSRNRSTMVDTPTVSRSRLTPGPTVRESSTQDNPQEGDTR